MLNFWCCKGLPQGLKTTIRYFVKCGGCKLGYALIRGEGYCEVCSFMRLAVL